MFGLGFGEIVIILVLALVLLGPQRLPDAAKQLGKGLREFKKATEDLKQQFEGELYADHKPAPRQRLPEPGPTPAAAAATPDAPPAAVPPGGVPPAAAAPAPAATAANVPGLDAALADPDPLPGAPAPAPAAPAAAPGGPGGPGPTAT